MTGGQHAVTIVFSRMGSRSRPATSFVEVTRRLAAVGRRFDSRNWVLGTSGNFSAVLSREPLRLVITASASHKGQLTRQEFLQVDGHSQPVGRPRGRPSAETRLHVAIAGARQAGAVLHTHSVWGTILSDLHADAGGLTLQGYEMLKGLAGIVTHDHHEWVPIVGNDQDMVRLSDEFAAVLRDHPACHGILLRRHGLYTWGATIDDAVRHVEILEFLFELVGRRSAPWP